MFETRRDAPRGDLGRRSILPRGYVPALCLLIAMLWLYFAQTLPSFELNAELSREVETRFPELEQKMQQCQEMEALGDALENDPAIQERLFRMMYPGAKEPGEINLGRVPLDSR